MQFKKSNFQSTKVKKDKTRPFKIPENITLMVVDSETGKKVNEDETKTIQSLLQRFGNSEKDAKKMIKKNYKKVNK